MRKKAKFEEGWDWSIDSNVRIFQRVVRWLLKIPLFESEIILNAMVKYDQPSYHGYINKGEDNV